MNCVTTGKKNEPDVGRSTRLLYLYFNKTYVNNWQRICFRIGLERARWTLVRNCWFVCLFVFFFFPEKGVFLHNKPFTHHTDQACSYIWPNTWPIFSFALGQYDGYFILNSSLLQGAGGGRVSKEIGGSVRLPVWRHVSRQWLPKWRAKNSSKRQIKVWNIRIYHGNTVVPISWILRF